MLFLTVYTLFKKILDHRHSPGIFPEQSKSKSSYTQVVIKLPRKNVELFSAWKRYVRSLMHLRLLEHLEHSKTVKLLWKHCSVAVTHGCSYLRVTICQYWFARVTAYSTIKARIIHWLNRSKDIIICSFPMGQFLAMVLHNQNSLWIHSFAKTNQHDKLVLR